VKTKSPPASALKNLETVIAKLERWQWRFSYYDAAGLSKAAKDRLLDLLREVESQRGKK
jgi:hypothetical protein